jgi:nucleoside-diphosphate-sugar epimerase
VNRVLVTGAGGFVGTPCVGALVDAGYEVHGVLPTGVTGPGQPGVTWYSADLLDPAQVRDVMSETRPSHLLHLAWFVAHGDYWTSPENLRWLQAGLDLAREFADAGGRRAVMVGTGAEYDSSSPPFVEEVTPLRPATLYGAAKAGLHLGAKAYMAGRGLSFAWAHLFYLFGPHEASDRLVPSAIDALLKGQPFVCRNPEDVRDFLYVDDVASALVALLSSDVQGDVNTASGEAVKVRTLINEVASELGRNDLVRCLEAPHQGIAPSVIAADTHRLTREVGWAPPHTRREAITATVAWWRQRQRARDGGSDALPDL